MNTNTQKVEMQNAYATQIGRKYWIMAVIIGLLVISFFIDVSTGPGNYPLSTVLGVFSDPESYGVRLNVIMWDYRLPIAVTAVLADRKSPLVLRL